MIIINFPIFFLFYFIINKYGPIYSLLCNIISEIISYIIIGKDYDLIELIIFIISILLIMIYLEIIELNFCGLNKNIKINIIKRGKSDINLIQLKNI